jgi:hypothetical protein
MIEFPKWKYHKTETALIVHTKEQEEALGHGWVNSPAHVDVPPAVEPQKKTRAPRAQKVKVDDVQST